MVYFKQLKYLLNRLKWLFPSSLCRKFNESKPADRKLYGFGL